MTTQALLNDKVFLYLLTSLSAAFLLTPVFIYFCKKLGLVDYPQSAPHKQHDRPVAKAGGLVIVVVLGLAVLLFPELRDDQIAGILPALMLVLAFGLVDDRWGLSAPLKLIGQLSAVMLLINGGIQVHLFSEPWLNIAVTVVWILGITNAFNFLDGGDGLALGIATVTAGFLCIASFISGQSELSVNLIVLIGSFLGFYFYNVRPAKAFLGDSGAQSLGFLLSVLALYYIPQGYTPWSSWFIPILLFSIPIFDMCLVVISRLRRRVPFYKGHLDHTYHRLSSMMDGDLRVQASMFLVAGFIDALALTTLNFTPLIGNVVLGLVILLGVVAMIYLEKIYSVK